MTAGFTTMSIAFWTLRSHWLALAGLILLPYLYIVYQRIRYRRQNDLFRVISENAEDMIAVVDATGKRLYNSPSYQKVLGYSPEELIATGSLQQIHPEDIERVIEAAKQARSTGVGKRLEYRMRHKDGSWRVLESTASAIRNRKGDVTRLVIVNRDITERKHIEQQMEHNALHDELTDLPNRRLFLERLQHAMEYSKRNADFKFAVLVMDIGGLKIFNETMGHTVVDQLIVEISGRLKARIRHDDTITPPSTKKNSRTAGGDETLARMDGDRFMILLEGTKTPSDPMRVALRVQECLATPFVARGIEVFTSASIGIALSDPSYHKPAEMLRDADIAMCRVKAQNMPGCQVFDAHMHTLVVQRMKLETELRKAVERGEFRVFYQPIVRLSTGQITGVEALVRWLRNETEIVCPADFIGVAEETGLIVPINRWVFKEACAQGHAWHSRFGGDPRLTVAVNISPRQLAHRDLVADLKSALDETGMDPRSLQLEITETMAMADPQIASRVFSQFKDIGVSLSIDDFGTGHSSLSRLRSFPVDVLKIDRSFVCGVERDGDAREIARLIVMLAHQLRLKVIAEGIETSGQYACLKQFGCEFGQGFFFSPAVDRISLEKLLERDRLDPVQSAVNGGSQPVTAI
jgi:PAS domain S-box-containing protein